MLVNLHSLVQCLPSFCSSSFKGASKFCLKEASVLSVGKEQLNFCVYVKFSRWPPPLSSCMTVKHGPCLLTLRKGSMPLKTKCLRKLLNISYLEHKTDRVQSKIISLMGPQEPLPATVKREKLAWFWQVAETASLKPSFRGPWSVMVPWSAEEMRDKQHQRVAISAYARTAHKGLLQERLEEDLC